MIQPENTYALWAILLFSALFGMVGERLGWFKRISGALMTILVASLFTTFGIIPSASDTEISVPTYDFIFTYFIPLSVPLLLFKLNIRKVIQESGRLLIIYLISAAATVLGALIAFAFIELGPETYKVVSVFIGTYIGGSVNFMSIADTFDFLKSPLFPSVIAVDNIFTNIYIMLLFTMPAFPIIGNYFIKQETSGEKVAMEQFVDENPNIYGGLLESLTTCLMITVLICLVGTQLSDFLAGLLNTDINLDMLVITLIIVILSNSFPSFFQRYDVVSFDLGMFLMYVFLAVIGAAADIKTLFTSVPSILIMATIILMTQLLVSMFFGRLLKFSLKEILLACAANAGGPSVATPMAVTFQMRKAVTPVILIAILGYMIGTFIGVGIGVMIR